VGFIVVEIKDGFNKVMKEEAGVPLQQQMYKTKMSCKHIFKHVSSQ